MPSRCPAAVTATAHSPSASVSRPVRAARRTAALRPADPVGHVRDRAVAPPAAARRRPARPPSSRAARPARPRCRRPRRPPSTTSANRSCAAAACSIPACAVDSAAERGGRLGGAAGLHQRHRGERGQRAEQRHLVAGGTARRLRLAANSTPTNCAVDQQRGAADRDQALLADGGVDLGGVPEPLVGGVVGGPVRPAGLRDEPAEPGAGAAAAASGTGPRPSRRWRA